MSDSTKKYFCPRLLDYIILVGPRTTDISSGQVSPSLGGHNRVPHLLRRYPSNDHQDFALPPDVVIFCQPEGCDRVESTMNAYNNPSQTTNSFVFLLTEKDTSRVRYGVCLNFYRPLQKCPHKIQNNLDTNETTNKNDSNSTWSTNTDSACEITTSCSNLKNDNQDEKYLDNNIREPQHRHHHHKKQHDNNSTENRANTTPPSKDSKIVYALNSICIISHHPFFSTFRECLYLMKKFIQACDEKNLSNPITNSQTQEHYPRCRCFKQQSKVAKSTTNRTQVTQKSYLNRLHKYSCPYSNPIWSLLTMPDLDENSISSPTALNDVAQIEAWILKLLSVPVPVPEKTKIQVEIMPTSLKQPLLFALPDQTRFSLIDFPLHLPLELLGVQTCLQVLTCILLENKVALQSKDYNALSMSVMAFVTMIYPLEYMFPVIPLLPSCMSSAEQLLLAPTPFIIGFPSSFFKFRCNFTLPNDVWIVDLDANKVKKPSNVEELPPLPEYEGSILIKNLQKILNSMSTGDATNQTMATHLETIDSTTSITGNTQYNFKGTQPMNSNLTRVTKYNEIQTGSTPSSPYKQRSSSMATAGQLLQFAANKISGSSTNTIDTSLITGNNQQSPASSTRSSFAMPTAPTFEPLTIINNDIDAVDVATRIAMVRFFNSHEVLANFVEHTRTIRLYPRPVVSFQKSSFIQSRAKVSQFLLKLVETQAVEYMAEWALCPDNVAFQRIQTGVYDPSTIGDKPKWYGNQLEPLKFQIWDTENTEFYDEICAIIKNPSKVSGYANSTGKFSDYYDDQYDMPNEEQSDTDKDDSEINQHDNFKYDINNNDMNEETHSPYISSADSSPCYSGDEETKTNLHKGQDKQGEISTLKDVMNMRLRKSSISSSISSFNSWTDNQIMQSIPADYQHDIGRFPPIRCDINKYYKPTNNLITTMQDTPKTGQIEGVDISKSTKHQKILPLGESIDSSDDDNDSSKVVRDSSSCEESVTEEFNFDSINPQFNTNTCDNPLLINMDDNIKKNFESVDSDTVVATSDNVADENKNMSGIETMSTTSIDSLETSYNDLGQNLEDTKQVENTNTTSNSTQTKTETLNSIINTQKMRVTTGVAKLLERTSSIGESKFQKQNSQTGSENHSTLAKNIGGDQMNAFLDRFTSEARDAVKEAKAALDAGKNVLKTTAMPAADAGRQKLLKNFQNLGEALFEDRRDSSASSKDIENLSKSQNSNNPNNSKTPSRIYTKSPDLNGIAGKANNMLSGWIGTKATGFASRVRDRTRPSGPFPSSKYI